MLIALALAQNRSPVRVIWRQPVLALGFLDIGESQRVLGEERSIVPRKGKDCDTKPGHAMPRKSVQFMKVGLAR